jgi:hypothetical protein
MLTGDATLDTDESILERFKITWRVGCGGLESSPSRFCSHGFRDLHLGVSLKGSCFTFYLLDVTEFPADWLAWRAS